MDHDGIRSTLGQFKVPRTNNSTIINRSLNKTAISQANVLNAMKTLGIEENEIHSVQLFYMPLDTEPDTYKLMYQLEIPGEGMYYVDAETSKVMDAQHLSIQ